MILLFFHCVLLHFDGAAVWLFQVPQYFKWWIHYHTSLFEIMLSLKNIHYLFIKFTYCWWSSNTFIGSNEFSFQINFSFLSCIFILYLSTSNIYATLTLRSFCIASCCSTNVFAAVWVVPMSLALWTKNWPLSINHFISYASDRKII